MVVRTTGPASASSSSSSASSASVVGLGGVRLRLRAGFQLEVGVERGVDLDGLEVGDVRGALQLEFAVELGLVVRPGLRRRLRSRLGAGLRDAAALTRGAAAFSVSRLRARGTAGTAGCGTRRLVDGRVGAGCGVCGCHLGPLATVRSPTTRMVDPRRRCVRCSPRRSPLAGLLDPRRVEHPGGRPRRAPTHCNGACHRPSASHPSTLRRCAGRSPARVCGPFHQRRPVRRAGVWSDGAVNDRAAPPAPAQQPASRAVSRTLGSTAGVAAADAPGRRGPHWRSRRCRHPCRPGPGRCGRPAAG